MTIYISVPVKGQNDAKAREKADMIKSHLSRHGHRAVNPFEIYAGKNAGFKDRLVSALRVLMDCDAVYFASEWNDSKNCRIEYVTAMEFGLTKMFEESAGGTDGYYYNM